MIKVKLTRLQSNHQNLRTNEIVGVCESLPMVGRPFSMMAPGLEFGTRFINTTTVLEINSSSSRQSSKRAYVFKTRNSSYGLDVLEDGEPESDVTLQRVFVVDTKGGAEVTFEKIEKAVDKAEPIFMGLCPPSLKRRVRYAMGDRLYGMLVEGQQEP